MATRVDERGNKVPDTNEKVVVSGIEARQGLLGKPVLMVLIGGLVLAMVAWAAAEMFGESTDNDAATTRQQVTPAKDNTMSSQGDATGQGTVDNTPPAGNTMQTTPADKDPTPETGTNK